MGQKISVVIATYNESRYIGQTLLSLEAMDYPKDDIEILIVDGNSTDNTLELIEPFKNKWSSFFVLHNPKRISPVAFNMGIQHAKGDFVVVMSGHSTYPTNYFKVLTGYFKTLDADLIGGYSVSKTISQNPKSKSIVTVMGHKLGLGGAAMRIGVSEPTIADTANGMFRKSVFAKVGLFNERLVRNQDMELSKRITAAGGKIYIIPDASWDYYARDNFSDLWKNNFRNGLWVPLTIYITRNSGSLSIRHFAPMIFVLSVFLPLLASVVWFPLAFLGLASVLFHVLVITAVSLKINTKETRLRYLISTFLSLHYSYGLGSAVGILKLNELFSHNE
jgi:cellulose synthase/poly-beta-1,6-N-acetylglucosamine synthase-like glycosyltransferase